MEKNKNITGLITEAERYLDNARNTLKKAGRENGFYKDAKYVKIACGTAYHAVLLAADAYLLKKENPIVKSKGQRKKVEDYQLNLSKLNKKVLDHFNSSYRILHLLGYYDGEVNAKVINTGLELAETIIHVAKK